MSRIPSTKAASVTRWLVPVDASVTHNRRGGVRCLVGAVAIVKSPRSGWIDRNVEHPADALGRGASTPTGLIRGGRYLLAEAGLRPVIAGRPADRGSASP